MKLGRAAAIRWMLFMGSRAYTNALKRARFAPAVRDAKRIRGDRSDLALTARAREALDGADALVIVTEWKEFRSPDFDHLKKVLKSPVVFDGRNLYDPVSMKKQGFKYYAIGRGDRAPT